MEDMRLSIICSMCNSVHTVVVKKKDYCDCMNGKDAQDAFPYLSDDERDEIITKLCIPCQQKLMFEEDEY